MLQSTLLARDARLIDDASGTVSYHPDVIDAAEAAAHFDALRAAAQWQQQRREMYGRMVDVPRLVAGYRLDDPAAPASLAVLAACVARVDAAAFNTAGLNLYRDGNDSVAPHNDHLHEIRDGQPIALVSLGATRRMVIREKHAPHRTLKLDLEAGSVLVMSYATQLHYDHGIPKQSAAVGPRISVAFRVRPDPNAVYGAGRFSKTRSRAVPRDA